MVLFGLLPPRHAGCLLAAGELAGIAHDFERGGIAVPFKGVALSAAYSTEPRRALEYGAARRTYGTGPVERARARSCSSRIKTPSC
jgi:hypothetical protein